MFATSSSLAISEDAFSSISPAAAHFFVLMIRRGGDSSDPHANQTRISTPVRYSIVRRTRFRAVARVSRLVVSSAPRNHFSGQQPHAGSLYRSFLARRAFVEHRACHAAARYSRFSQLRIRDDVVHTCCACDLWCRVQSRKPVASSLIGGNYQLRSARLENLFGFNIVIGF